MYLPTELSIFCFQIRGKDVYNLITEQFATEYHAIMSYGVSCSIIHCPSCVPVKVEKTLLFLINVPDSGNQHSPLTEILRLACLYSTEYKKDHAFVFLSLVLISITLFASFIKVIESDRICFINFNNFPFHIHVQHTHIAAQYWKAPHWIVQ